MTVQVIERVGRILDAFTSDRPAATLTECARVAGLTKSSAHRLLVSLEAVGLVERNGSTWRLGSRVISLASVRLGDLNLQSEASPRLRELGREFRAAVAFSVPDGTDMIYVERHESPVPFAPSARLGGRAPIWAGASGRAILSQLPPAERERHLDSDEWRRLSRTVQNDVLAEVERAAERGYAIDAGFYFEGVAGVATAIRDRRRTPIAAMSVIVSPDRLDEKETRRIGERLRDTAAELETILGLPTPSRGRAASSAPVESEASRRQGR